MNAKKKPVLLLLTIILVTGLFIGCSKTSGKTSIVSNGNSGSDKENSASNSGNSTNDNTDLFGQVTAINDNTITLTVFSGGGNRPNTQSGDRPDMQSGDRPDMQSGDRPDTQSGDRPDMQSGDRPDIQSGERPDMQSVETEEKEITISDESVISVEDGNTTKAGTLADIAVGSTLQISYTTDTSGKEVISAVIVKNISRGGNGNVSPSSETAGSSESEG